MTKKIIITLLAIGMIFIFSACSRIDKVSVLTTEPLWTPAKSVNKILVIGDLHLGTDLKYSETVENRSLFVEFLKRIEKTTDIRELVFNGDFFDDWFLPLTYPRYDDADEFYRQLMANNQDIVDIINNLIAQGVKVVFIPGNHDMLLKSEVLEEAMPGIFQARDSEGLGTYITGDRQEIAIEHGHRYDVFSAPDSVTNRELTQSDETLLPPGYFYARIAASWVLQGRPLIKKDYPVVTNVPDAETNLDQYNAYLYFKILNPLFTKVSNFERFEDKVFDLGIAGFNGSYSLQDFYPIQQSDGTISAPVLFKNFQRTWEERQEINQVLVKNSFSEAVIGALKDDYYFQQAKVQYLQNLEKSIDVVVFNHTHTATYRNEEDKLYVNAGTWIDHNNLTPDINRTFAVITTGANSNATIYEYMTDGTISDIKEKVSIN